MITSGIKRYEFLEKDFELLTFPIHLMRPKDRVLVKFPVLNTFPEFKLIRPLSFDRIFKYVVYMYDWNSPLRVQIDDYKVRKANAMFLAGYELQEHGDFSDDINDVLLNKNEDVMKIIFRYARMTMGERYSTLVSLQAGYQTTLLRVSSGDNRAYNDLKGLRDKIDFIMKEMLSDDNFNRVDERFLDYVDMETLGIRPEDIAMSLNSGMPVLLGVNPYDLKHKKVELTQSREKHLQKLRDHYGATTN